MIKDLEPAGNAVCPGNIAMPDELRKKEEQGSPGRQVEPRKIEKLPNAVNTESVSKIPKAKGLQPAVKEGTAAGILKMEELPNAVNTESVSKIPKAEGLQPAVKEGTAANTSKTEDPDTIADTESPKDTGMMNTDPGETRAEGVKEPGGAACGSLFW